MRADRLIALVLLLRQRGLSTAPALARELEVSARTVLRDIESLSAAGVPVYAERGRHGGFALLPGFAPELAGLNHDEALALLIAGSGRGEQAFGLGSALASAVRKVLDALPEAHRVTVSDAAQRILVDPDTDLGVHSPAAQELPATTMVEIRRAVLNGNQLRLHYASAEGIPQWRKVHPIGLVTVRDRGYLLATRSGQDRTYRLSRVLSAEELDEPAERPDRVDLDRIWRKRCAQFLSGGDELTALVRVSPARRWELATMVVAVRTDESEDSDADGWARVEVTFENSQHAEWALWQLAADAETLSPQWLRSALHERAAELAHRYAMPARPEQTTPERAASVT